MVNSGNEGDLYEHVGHDFSVVNEMIKSLVVGNSTTVAELVRQLDDLLGDVQTQTYNEQKERQVYLTLEMLEEESQSPDTEITPEQAARVRESAEHALEAYRVSTQKKGKHSENQ